MPPVDAARFCIGAPLDGTCVQAFFAKYFACYRPAGCCTCMVGNHIALCPDGTHVTFGYSQCPALLDLVLPGGCSP